MSDNVKEAICNLKRFGSPASDPVSKEDINNLIKYIVALAEALSDCNDR